MRSGIHAAIGFAFVCLASPPAWSTPDAALGGGLRELVASAETHNPALPMQLELHLTNRAKDPLVRIRLAPGTRAAAVLPELAKNGFELTTLSSIDPSLLEGYLPLANTRAVTKIAGIAALHATQKPGHNFGTVPHQAAILEKADVVQAHGVDGTGISVGVLSDSFNTCGACATTASQDVAAGNLPAKGVTVLEDFANGTDEGRAMLQLVYDIAPGANLGFATADVGQLGFAENILALRTQFAADVIIDDVYYFAEPFYSDGTIAQAVDAVTRNGAAYFSAAGNNGLEAYEATYVPVPYAKAAALARAGKTNIKLDQIPAAIRPMSFHDFKNADGSESITQLITSNGLNGNNIEFQWDEPFDLGLVKTDYNIYIFDADGNWVNPITSFYVFYTTDDNLQTDEPNEYLFLSATPSDIVGATNSTDYQIVIGKMNDGPAERIKYIVLNSLAPSVRQNAPSIYGHAAASGGQAVAAAYYAIPAFPEDFSAQGPATILFDTLGNRLAKPDVRPVPQITAADGVDNTILGSDIDGDGFPNFFGTSAAAPDAGAVAALVLQHAGGPGSMRPKAVYAALQASATPIVVADQRWLGKAVAGPVTLTINGDWTRWDRDFTLSVDPGSKHSVTAVTIDTTVDALIWNPSPDRFSIGSSNGLTYADIFLSPLTASAYQLDFVPGTFLPGGEFSFGLSVYNPLEGSTREDPDRLRGATVTVTLDDNSTYAGTIRSGALVAHGAFTGAGLVNAYKAVFR
jgi:hypothetical protein